MRTYKEHLLWLKLRKTAQKKNISFPDEKLLLVKVWHSSVTLTKHDRLTELELFSPTLVLQGGREHWIPNPVSRQRSRTHEELREGGQTEPLSK
ncbi:hypothetical protein CEXT_141571 [Caerostris extrusa]|uniref:Uncharacterized protein n=1 Tax=Caerostris extrusa TaxID=172846 RepID=A0AAV4VFF8_CAEEX|nr:hypothetical protein CEXT_141571 [Caerostris extrusa]